MALRYYHEFRDRGNHLHRVEIHSDTVGGGSELITHSTGKPTFIKHGGSRDKPKIIKGKEFQFSFFVFDYDHNKYDDIIESDFKDFYVLYDIDGILQFHGWINPENLSREHFKEAYVFNLSATDGLAWLKDVSFRNFADDQIIEGPRTFLQFIQLALEWIEIQLPLRIQLNTWETTAMTVNQCALNELGAYSQRFLNQGSGNPISCYDVIEQILKPFSCTLKQENGYYLISNKHELDSPARIFAWSTLAAGTVATSDKIVDLAGRWYEKAELSKIAPKKEIEITWKNRDLGFGATGVDLSDWDTNFAHTFDTLVEGTGALPGTIYYIADGEVRLTSGVNFSGDYIELLNVFSVTRESDEDFIRISFTHRTYPAGAGVWNDPFIQIFIYKPNQGWIPDTDLIPLTFVSTNFNSKLKGIYRVHESGDYNIRIRFYARNANSADLWFYLRDLTVNKVHGATDADAAQAENLILDAWYLQDSEKNVGKLEETSLLGDAVSLAMCGAVLDDPNGTPAITAAWNNSYTGASGILLLDVWARNVLNDRYDYKSFMRFTVHDIDNTIYLDSVLSIEGKYYTIISYSRDGKMGLVQCDVEELLTAAQSYEDIQFAFIDEVDGVSTTQSENNSNENAIAHNFTMGLQGGDEGEYYHLLYSQWSELSNWLDNVILSDAGGIDMDGELKVDTINEHGSAGIDIESVLFKDGNIGTSSDYQGTAYLTSWNLRSDQNNVLTYSYVYSTNAGHCDTHFTYRYGGTVASPAAALTDSVISYHRNYAYDGTSDLEILRYVTRIDGSVATDNIAGKYQWQLRPSGAAASLTLMMELNEDGLALKTGARVDTIETTLTDDDTHLPTSGAVYDHVSGFGYVDAIGTPADDQVAVFTDANTIEGDANLTWNGTVLALNAGQIQITGVDYPLIVRRDNSSISYSNNVYSNASGHQFLFYVYRYGGTYASPTVTPANANILQFRALAYDGAASLDIARMLIAVDGTPSTGNVSGEITFWTRETTGALTEHMRLAPDGALQINVIDEKAGAAGITVDGGLLKDNKIGDASNYWAAIYNDLLYLKDPGGTIATLIDPTSSDYLYIKVGAGGTYFNTASLNNFLRIYDYLGTTYYTTIQGSGTFYTTATNMTFQDVSTGPHTLSDLVSGGTPDPHASTHENGGADEISVTDLSGLLADAQTPLTHASSHEIGGADLVNHDNLTGYVASRHINHISVDIIAGLGLSGGGDISATMTINLDLSDLVAIVTLADADQFGVYDSEVGQRKITYANLITELNGDLTVGSHTHGNITNAGAIGAAANLPIITTTSGVLTVGSFGTGANTFCQGNDSRLSDSRTPTAHASSHHTGGGDLVTHDSLTGFVGNEHIDHTGVSMGTAATSGLNGGGTIAATRALVLAVERLTAVTTLQTTDYFPFYDASGSGTRRISYANMITALNGDLSFGSSDITMDGSTANGIVTYGGADNIDVESNLTFDGSTLTVTGDISCTGKVGIGATPSATYELLVNGQTSSGMIYCSDDVRVGTDTDYHSRLTVVNGTASTYGLYIIQSANYGLIKLENSHSSDTEYYIHAGDSPTDRFYVTTSGKGYILDMGVGAAIDAQSHFRAYNATASEYAGFFHHHGDNVLRYGIQIRCGKYDQSGAGTQAYYVRCFDGDGGDEGAIIVDTGTLQFLQASDARRKTNIEDVSIDIPGILSGIPVREFDMLTKKGKLGGHNVGWIAQEVDKVYSPMASYDKENDFWGVKPGVMIPLLHRGWQLHEDRFETHEQKIKRLERRVKYLENKLKKS